MSKAFPRILTVANILKSSEGISKTNTLLEVIMQIMVLMESAKLGAWPRENIKLLTFLSLCSQILLPLLLGMRWINRVCNAVWPLNCA